MYYPFYRKNRKLFPLNILLLRFLSKSSNFEYKSLNFSAGKATQLHLNT